jgi:hypothetical protein
VGGEGRRKRRVVKWSTCHKYKQDERRKWRHDSYETTEVKTILLVDFVHGSQNKGFTVPDRPLRVREDETFLHKTIPWILYLS